MFIFLSRVIKYGWQNFWRNKWVSCVAIIILTFTLLIFSLIYFSSVFANQTLTFLKNKIDISVYFKKDTPEEEILKIKESLETLSEVKEVKYISAAQALLSFKEKHKENKTIMAALAELKDNPLKPSLEIKAKDPKYYSEIASSLKNEKFNKYIDKITYFQNKLVIERFIKIINFSKKIGFLCAFILLFIACAVTFNTILLVIYSAREEIATMRLVGASNSFISYPFIFTGAFYGFFASLVAFLFDFLLIQLVSSYVFYFIPSVDLSQFFLDHLLLIFLSLIAGGVFLGSFSSYLATKRYLNV